MKRYGLYIIIILFNVFLLTHCSKPTVIDTQLNIHSARYLNPDINGKTAPIVLTLYELKAPYSFKSSDYSALINNPAKILGTNLIDKQSFEIQPNNSTTLTQIISPQTRYLGIIAGYRNIQISDWRQVIPVAPGISTMSIQINLASQSLVAKAL